MAERVAACFVVDETHVVTRRSELGVHLGEALELLVTEVAAEDDALDIPSHDRRIKAAMRALASDLGVLACTTPPGMGEVDAVTAATDRGVPLAAALATYGLSLGFDRAVVLGRFEARGDVVRDTYDVVVIHVSREKLHGEFAHLLRSREGVERDWALGRDVPSPMLSMALRGFSHGFSSTGFSSSTWEVAPSLRMIPVRTPTLPPATHTNAFMVGSGEFVLVEPATPYPEELDRLVAEVEEARACGLQLVAILATHHHPDHIGGAMALKRRLGAPLFAHAATAQRLEGEVTFDRLLVHGERIALDGPSPTELVAIHTPGHAPGHLCFMEARSKALIAGDMVAGVGTILVETHDGDMTLYLESLRAMRALEPSMLLPAHGGVVRDPGALLDHYVAHRLAREAKVLDALLRVGPSSSSGLVPVAYDDAPKAVWPLAAMSVQAHLEKLVRDGKVVRNGAAFAAV